MKRTQSFTAMLFLVLSICGISLIVLMTASSPSVQDVFWRKPFLGILFCAECTLGIFVGTLPSKFSGLLHSNKAHPMNQIIDNEKMFLGHHPCCGRFNAHIINLRSKVSCAGCTGLIIGAIFSLSGVVLYFFLDFHLPASPFFPFWLGVIGVYLGLLQYHLFNWGGNIIHLLINVYFVFGVFLLLMAIDAITKNWIIEMYLIILSIFWIITRIKLSQADHKRICTNCSTNECECR